MGRFRYRLALAINGTWNPDEGTQGFRTPLHWNFQGLLFISVQFNSLNDRLVVCIIMAAKRLSLENPTSIMQKGISVMPYFLSIPAYFLIPYYRVANKSDGAHLSGVPVAGIWPSLMKNNELIKCIEFIYWNQIIKSSVSDKGWLLHQDSSPKVTLCMLYICIIKCLIQLYDIV